MGVPRFSTSVAALTPCGRDLRILLVEDNSDTAHTTTMMLHLSRFYQVWAAPDGPSALLMAAANPPDVVLLDIGLPGLGGFELAQLIREQRAEAGRPFLIAVTAYGSSEDRRRSREAGIDLHLVKPVDWDELQSVLENRRALPVH
jgi:CheY-like chemotaxis protein